MLQHLPNFSLEAQVIPFREEFAGNVQRPLILLLAAVGIVLLIGCTDVANLMFAAWPHAEGNLRYERSRCGFWRLTRQTLTEGLLLSAGRRGRLMSRLLDVASVDSLCSGHSAASQ